MRTTKQPELFGLPVIGVLCALLATYVVIAEWSDFHLIGLHVPGSDLVVHRAEECIILWTVGCLLYGWVCFTTGRGRDRPVPTPRVVLPPIVAGLLMAARSMWTVVTDDDAGRSAGAAPATAEIVLALAPIVWAAWASVILWVHVHFARRYGRSGVCPQCRYDLTGNISGTCPECGRPTPKSVQRESSPVRSWRVAKFAAEHRARMLVAGVLFAAFGLVGLPFLARWDPDMGAAGQRAVWIVVGLLLVVIGLVARRG